MKNTRFSHSHRAVGALLSAAVILTSWICGSLTVSAEITDTVAKENAITFLGSSILKDELLGGKQGMRMGFTVPDVGRTVDVDGTIYTVESMGTLTILQDKMEASGIASGEEMVIGKAGSNSYLKNIAAVNVKSENGWTAFRLFITHIPKVAAGRTICFRPYCRLTRTDADQTVQTLYLYGAVHSESLTTIFNRLSYVDQSVVPEAGSWFGWTPTTTTTTNPYDDDGRYTPFV